VLGFIAIGPSAVAQGPEPWTIAVIGDIPYTADQLTPFPTNIGTINTDPDVSLAVHLGDIKSGSTVCSDSYFATVRSDFDLFVYPLVSTPEDNEWTDCHRAAAGSYQPLERLGKLRQVFFPTPGTALGINEAHVSTQARRKEESRRRHGATEAAGEMRAPCYLVLRSGWFLAWIGVLLIAGCFGYLVDTFATFLAPLVGDTIEAIVLASAAIGQLSWHTC
jgi:hypothetical protein